MLADIYKALELLVEALKAITHPGRKKVKLARRLKDIYLTILDIVDRGKEILGLLKGDAIIIKEGDITVYEITFDNLIHQQRALQKLIEHLNGKDIAGHLRLYRPDFGSLRGLIDRKFMRIGIFISQLINSKYPPKNQRKKWAAQFQKIMKKFEKEDPKEYFFYMTWKKFYAHMYYLQASLFDRDSEIKNVTIQDFGRYERCLSFLQEESFTFKDVDNVGIVPVSIFATPKDIEEARRLLNEIARLGENLRVFLVQTFEIQDF